MIEEKINKFITEYDMDSANHFLLRKDGICLYSNFSKEGSESTIALMAGMWQASEALGKFANIENEEGRICYESSSSGIIIHKLNNNTNLIYAVQYSNIVNPGYMKMKLKNMISKIDEEKIEETYINNKINYNSEFLFSEISDDEIDRMFNF